LVFEEERQDDFLKLGFDEIQFSEIRNGMIREPNDFFDLVNMCCVLHHIEPQEHASTLKKIYQCLKTGGRLTVFEHNPLNPLTKFVGQRAKIDEHAILIYPKNLVKTLLDAGFQNVRLEYLLFFPPRLKSRWLENIEQHLSNFPLGAQYYVVGEK